MPSKSGRIAAVVQYSDKYGDGSAQIVANRRKMPSKDKAFPRQEQTTRKDFEDAQLRKGGWWKDRKPSCQEQTAGGVLKCYFRGEGM